MEPMPTAAVFFFANPMRFPAALVFAYSAKRTLAVFCAEFHAFWGGDLSEFVVRKGRGGVNGRWEMGDGRWAVRR